MTRLRKPSTLGRPRRAAFSGAVRFAAQDGAGVTLARCRRATEAASSSIKCQPNQCVKAVSATTRRFLLVFQGLGIIFRAGRARPKRRSKYCLVFGGTRPE